jgi:hypothetical protein
MSPLLRLSILTCAWLATAAAAQASDPAVEFKLRYGQRLITQSDAARGVLSDVYGARSHCTRAR